MKGGQSIKIGIAGLVSVLVCSVGLAGEWQEFAVEPTGQHQESPDIYGNTIVFQQLVAGGWDIYAVELTGPEVAFCTGSIDGDVNANCKVDYGDFAMMASQWLVNNLEAY